MKSVGRTVSVVIAGLVVAAVVASNASAGCVDPVVAALSGSRPGVPYGVAPGFAFPELGAPSSPTVNFQAPGVSTSTAGPSIVGLWQVMFTAEGNGNNAPPFNIPDGVVIDAAYAQWHSDNTEIMNSSRDPVTSSICLGVWRGVGNRTYRLNHFALSWDDTGHLCTPPSGATNCFVGVANIREEVTVDPQGNTYTGSFTITQYDSNGQQIFELKGTIAARRITAD